MSREVTSPPHDQVSAPSTARADAIRDSRMSSIATAVETSHETSEPAVVIQAMVPHRSVARGASPRACPQQDSNLQPTD